MTKHKIYMEDLIYSVLTDKKEGSLVGSKLRCSIKVLPGGAKSFERIGLIGLFFVNNYSADYLLLD